MKIKDLKPAEYNPSEMSEEKLELLGKAMREFGDLSGVVVNVRTGRMIGGHKRVKHFDPSWPIRKHAATDITGTVALGEIETPFGVWQYREVDWPETREMAANLAANKHGGEFDEVKLKDIFARISDGSIDTALTGFTEHEIRDLVDAPVPELRYEETELKPYRMTHVLISFPPENLMLIQEHLEKIMAVDGIEYEQSAN